MTAAASFASTIVLFFLFGLTSLRVVDSLSTTTTTTTTSNIKRIPAHDSPLWQMKTPSRMFLPRSFQRAIGSIFANRFGGRPTTSTTTATEDDKTFIGFHFDTSLLMNKKKKSVEDDDDRIITAQQQQQKTPSSWIPSSREQIDLLSLSDLKDACTHRDIPMHETKSQVDDLRLALWDWSLLNQPATEEVPSNVPDSLQAWARGNEQRLLRKGKEMKEQASKPRAVVAKPLPVTMSMESLKRSFDAPVAELSNKQVHDLYKAARQADRAGQTLEAMAILNFLKDAAPMEPKVFTVLARLYTERGNFKKARQSLDEGLMIHPNNGHLWLGLATIAKLVHATNRARDYLHQAIRVDPALAAAYHFLGTLEHQAGRVALAMRTLKKGLDYEPTCHRLHHALGDIYRGAMMQDMAKNCYLKALETAPESSKPLAYKALSYTAYENNDVALCRHWLKKGVEVNGGQSEGSWVAWARMEEAQGNVEEARQVIYTALSHHEETSFKNQKKNQDRWKTYRRDSLRLLQQVSASSKRIPRGKHVRRAQFENVYKNWARLERHHGTDDSVDDVFARAIEVFPGNWKYYDDWATYYAKRGNHDRARELYGNAIQEVAHRNTNPYRHLAELELSLGRYKEASLIFYRGAKAVAKINDGGLAHQSGFARLYHSWAVCEWHLGHLSRAQQLFDHALRMTHGDETEFRSYIFYSMARLEYCKGEYELAQHYVGLSLKENLMPGGNSKIWELWLDVATAMNNLNLVHECKAQLERLRRQEEKHGLGGRLLSVVPTKQELAQFTGMTIAEMVTLEPWMKDLVDDEATNRSFFLNGVNLPILAPPAAPAVRDETLLVQENKLLGRVAEVLVQEKVWVFEDLSLIGISSEQVGVRN